MTKKMKDEMTKMKEAFFEALDNKFPAEEEPPLYDEDGYDIKCEYCNARWVDKKVNGVWIHADCENDEEAPKCAEDGCENHAAKNEYYPNSEGGKYWTLCEECYDNDQDDE
jgi:hypothetical protein